MQATGVSNPKEALLSEVRTEYERVTARLRELQSLIEQSQQEVKRLQQRSVDVNTQLNRLEANFDNVPRPDIKIIYNNALDIKGRLLTMQGQLEKVQQDRSQLESFSAVLKQVLDRLEGINPQAFASAGVVRNPGAMPGGTGPLSNNTIVRIVETQESERQRLARQLHDGPAQSLTNFILQAEICQRLFDRNPDRAVEELGNLKTAASTTFQKVRDFIFDLRPMMLDDLGLVPTVRRYTTAFAEKNGMDIELTVSGDEHRRVESHAEVTVFRGIQEILGYSKEFTGSTRVDIMVDVASDIEVRVTIDFNGKSIDEVENAPELSNQSGRVFSLSTLKERIELVGGSVEVYSSDGDSNKVDFNIPAQER
jgi:two-component system, NarL family, sensor histidine kinase DegS